MKCPLRGALPVGLAVWLAACAPSDSGFSPVRARAHVDRLAANVGSRPAGTERNRHAREYVVDQLKAAGFDVRIQQADAERPGFGLTARVSNIIATARPDRPQAIALMSHYDSVPDGPGAADAALGVAVCLEAGRVLSARPSRSRGLLVILTDGEELGLMGAAAVLADPIRTRIRAVLNFEAIGSGAPVMLFETGAASGGLLEAWARRAPQPAGASFMAEIYKLISPGGDRTDLGPLRRAGIAGLGFAAVGDGYTYHTPQDAPSRLDQRALTQAGENAVAIATALDAEDFLDRRSPVTTYFDLLGLEGVAYGARGELLALGLAVLVGLVAWVHVIGVASRAVKRAAVWLTIAWTLVGIAAVVGSMVAAAWLVRATREVLHPWYAHPDWYFAWLLTAGIGGGWLVIAAGARLPARFRGSAQPVVVWVIALPVWLLLAILAAWHATASAFLVEWPLVVSGVALLAFAIERPRGMGGASAVATVAAWTFWLPVAWRLLHFAVPELARTPLVTPVVFYPALVSAVAIFLAPPVLAMVGRAREQAAWGGRVESRDEGRWRGRRRMAVAGFVLAAGLSFMACWLAPAYTADRPLRHSIRYVGDVAGRSAAWEVAGNEAASLPGRWQDGPAPHSPALPLGALVSPFVAHSDAPPPDVSPVRVSATIVHTAEAQLELAAVPLQPGWTLAIGLPPDVIPLETNLAISMRRGRQVAVFEGVPLEGIVFRARFESSDAPKLSSTAVVAVGPGLPGADWPQLPHWLPRARDVWQARSYYLLPVSWR